MQYLVASGTVHIADGLVYVPCASAAELPLAKTMDRAREAGERAVQATAQSWQELDQSQALDLIVNPCLEHLLAGAPLGGRGAAQIIGGAMYLATLGVTSAVEGERSGPVSHAATEVGKGVVLGTASGLALAFGQLSVSLAIKAAELLIDAVESGHSSAALHEGFAEACTTALRSRSADPAQSALATARADEIVELPAALVATAQADEIVELPAVWVEAARTDEIVELPAASVEAWSQAVPKQVLLDAVQKAALAVRRTWPGQSKHRP